MNLYPKKKIKREEARKRIIFVIKLALLTILLYFRIEFDDISKDYWISSGFIQAVIFYATTHLIISFSRLILVYFYIKRNKLDEDIKNNFVLGINRIADIFSIGAFFLSLLLLFDIRIKEVFTSISIFAAALAILFKDYISNVINGLIIMFSDQLSLNDHVRIGAHKGRIVDVTLINVHIINDDEDLVYIPNNSVIATDVVNYTKRNIQKVSIDFELKSNLLVKLPELEALLVDHIKQHKNEIRQGSFAVKVVELNKESARLKFQVVLINQNHSLEKELRRTIPRKIIEFSGQDDYDKQN